MACLLSIEHLSKTFPGDDQPVVDDLGFCVHAGELFVLLGPSGCGKTTTLRMIGGFERPDGGWINVEEQPVDGPNLHVPPEKRRLGFVFQDYALFPHLNVLENVMFGLREHPRARRKAVATEVLWMVGLAGFEKRRPHDLSGGQQQRVALARAIAPWPRVLLLDEPFSNLDADLRQTMRREIRDIVTNTGMSAVLVTHDQEEALSVADRLAVMNDGRIEQIGTPQEVYDQPATPFVANFLGQTNLLTVSADGTTADSPLGPIQLPQNLDGPVTVSLRPEAIVMTPVDTDQPDAGRVIDRAFKGHDQTYRVQVGSHEFTVQTDHRCTINTGDSVTLRPDGPAAVVDRTASA